MRTIRATAVMGCIFAFTGPRELRADLNLVVFEQSASASQAEPIVVGQFFDLRADPAARFAERLTHDLFGRPATEAETRFDRDRLRSPSFPPEAFVHEKLLADEHIGTLVDDLFQRLHDRLPSALERTVYSQFLIHGFRESDLAVELLTAEPYASPLIETDPQAWLDDVFRRLSGRAPSAAESGELLTLYSMNDEITAVTQVIVNSDAVRTRVISDAYQKVLARTPTPEEAAGRLSEFASGSREMDVRSRLLLSAEYRDRDLAPSYLAVIDWGDGVSSNGGILENFDGGFITGDHAYAAEGTYVVTVTLVDDLGRAVATSARLTVHRAPSADTGNVYSVFAAYLDGPAETGLLPGETTGEASGAFLEDSAGVAGAEAIVAGESENAGDSTPVFASPTTALCGPGMPLAAGFVASFCAARRRGRRRRP